MANSASNVTAGKPKTGGAIYIAPLDTSLPENTSDSLTGFTCLGYVSEDGVTNDNSPESDSVKAWGGDTVLTLQTDRPDSFSFTLLEVLDEDVLKAVYGDSNVTTDSNGNISVKATSEALLGHAWVIDMIVRDGRAKRIVIPNGTVSNVSTITYSDTAAVGYGITITDVPDDDGVYHYEYISAESEISG